MEHRYIVENEIVSLYAMGKLAPGERTEFEEHLIGCPECQDELTLTDDFRGALRAAVPEYAATPPQAAGMGPRRWIPAMAGVAAVLCGLAALALFAQRQGFERELTTARAAAAEWERRYRGEEQARLATNSHRSDAGGAGALFTLNVTRGADLSGEPPNAVTLGATKTSVVLALEWQNDPAFETYRAKLTDGAGTTVWSADQIAPPVSGALAVTLPANLLKPGKALLTVEGSRGGQYAVAARYAFRITNTK